LYFVAFYSNGVPRWKKTIDITPKAVPKKRNTSTNPANPTSLRVNMKQKTAQSNTQSEEEKEDNSEVDEEPNIPCMELKEERPTTQS
jgi:hypothetical protein